MGYAWAMKKLLFAMAIGAALAWLFDPDAGSRRRDSLRAQARREGPHRLEHRAAGRAALGDRLHAGVRRQHPLIGGRAS